MPIENTESGIVITGEEIELARLMALRGALRAEARGLRMKRGRSINTIVCQELGLRKGTKCEVTLKALDERIANWTPSKS